VEQVCRRAIVINHGEIILDAPVAKMKSDYLRAKTVDLLLDEPAETLLTIDPASGQQHLYGALQNATGIQVLKAQGKSLKLEVDTSECPLEPVIAAIMQRCHILDMTIADPPMEEIIAAIYGEKGHEDEADFDSTVTANGGR
jgi:ABC-2 type transport system ATP-binding protein